MRVAVRGLSLQLAIIMASSCLRPVLLWKLHVKIHVISHRFYNMAPGWSVIMLKVNQILILNIFVGSSWPGSVCYLWLSRFQARWRDITYITSSLIGLDLAQRWIENGPFTIIFIYKNWKCLWVHNFLWFFRSESQWFWLLKYPSLISPLGIFPVWQKCFLYPLNHILTWQVSLQLSCRDTCQIWMWYSIDNQCFEKKN